MKLRNAQKMAGNHLRLRSLLFGDSRFDLKRPAKLARFFEKKMNGEIPNSDSDWDYPLTDEDLRSIDSVISSAPPPPKRHQLSCRHDDASAAHSPPKRRRLPSSLFSPCSTRSYSTRNRSPVSPFQDIKFGGRIVYSRTVKEVEKAAQELLDLAEAKRKDDGQCILGLDIEWRPSFRKGVAPGRAAVMQICGDNSCCHVLHIFHSGITKNLQRLLEEDASLKVGVGISGDVNKVLKDYDVSVNTSQDLSALANRKLGQDPKRWSLSSLTQELICRQLPKPNIIRLGNWEVPDLSDEQLKYAANDAYISWFLYQALSTYPDTVVKKEAAETNAT